MSLFIDLRRKRKQKAATVNLFLPATYYSKGKHEANLVNFNNNIRATSLNDLHSVYNSRTIVFFF